MVALNDCEGRKGFLSWDHANRSLGRGRFRGGYYRKQLTIFRCRYCAAWHIGSRS